MASKQGTANPQTQVQLQGPAVSTRGGCCAGSPRRLVDAGDVTRASLAKAWTPSQKGWGRGDGLLRGSQVKDPVGRPQGTVPVGTKARHGLDRGSGSWWGLCPITSCGPRHRLLGTVPRPRAP